MPELTFYPDAHPENTSVDGSVNHEVAYNAGLTWATIIAEAGSVSSDNVNGLSLTIKASNESNKWMILRRWVLLFDTSSIPDGAAIQSATLEIYGYGKDDALGNTPDCNIYASAPASNTALVAGDFDSLRVPPLCDTPITYANWNSAGMNSFALNTAGLAAISLTGITKLGVRNANYDVAGVSPTNWADQQFSSLSGYAAEKGGSFRPKLVVTYSDPPVADETIAEPTVVLEAIRNIEIVYGGRVYIDKSGNFTYETRYTRNV